MNAAPDCGCDAAHARPLNGDADLNGDFKMPDFHTPCGKSDLPDTPPQSDIAARMAEAVPFAAVCWLSAAGFVRPSGELIRSLAACMVAGLKLPPPSWTQQPRGPVEAEFERLRDEIVTVRELPTASAAD